MPATLPTGGPGSGGASATIDDVKPPDNPIVISLHKLGSDQSLIQIEGTNKAVRNSEDLFKNPGAVSCGRGLQAGQPDHDQAGQHRDVEPGRGHVQRGDPREIHQRRLRTGELSNED